MSFENLSKGDRAILYLAIERNIQQLAGIQPALPPQAWRPYQDHLDGLLKLLRGAQIFYGIPQPIERIG